MRTTVQRIKFPELFFGFVAPIGADLNSVLADFREKLAETGYQVVEIKATDVFPALKNYIIPKVELSRSPLDKRYYSYISYGNQLRSHFDDDAILAVSSIRQIVQKRIRFADITNSTPFEKTAFLIHQFKRKEEIDLLRSIYGRLFFQISVYSRKGARVDHLSRLFAKSQNVVGTSKFRSDAEALIQKDEDESDHSHGQRVAKIFHDADLIVSHDAPVSINEQISRFCDLVFSSNSISPTHIEYGMFLAKAAALRSLDLSRQVGAAIFSQEREIISLGSNEVPKATGGTYWCDDPFDDREYMHGSDSNERRKKEITFDLLGRFIPDEYVNDILKNNNIKEAQIMDALEYGRITHAEMSAICDAARTGRSVKSGTLFSTTFPCHMCAKHIVSAGLSKVIFLEPYPKSLASDLHSDSIQIENNDRGRYSKYPAVSFEHFYGVSPRRYREIFERSKRKNDDGQFQAFIDDERKPFIDIKIPVYGELEKLVIEQFGDRSFIEKLDEINAG